MNKPILVPLKREFKKGHEGDLQFNGVLPKLEWIVYYKNWTGEVTANFFVHEHKARDFAQEQSLREYLREANVAQE